MRYKVDIMHKKVKIKATGEIAYVVEYDRHTNHDSFILDLRDKNELPNFYKRADFEFLDKDLERSTKGE